MEIVVQIPAGTPPQELAWIVKHVLEGLALGYAPTFRRLKLPPLYHSGVQFRRDPAHGSGREEFALPAVSYNLGWVDCDRAVLWRLCELLLAGEAATCRCAWRHNEMHVLVRRESGALEDPSLVLMRQERNESSTRGSGGGHRPGGARRR